MQIDARTWFLMGSSRAELTHGELLRALLTLKPGLYTGPPLIQELRLFFKYSPFKVPAHAVLLKPQHDAAASAAHTEKSICERARRYH